MKLFGKTKTKMEIAAAEFLPYDQQLFITAIDSDCDLYIYQYDPDRKFASFGL